MHTRTPAREPSRALSVSFDLEKCLKLARPSFQAKRPSLSAKYRLRLYGPGVSISQASRRPLSAGARAQNRPRLSDNERSSDGTPLGLFLVAQAPKLKAFRVDCF